MLLAVTLALAFASVIMLMRLGVMHRNLKNITEEMKRNRSMEYNRRLTIIIGDRRMMAAVSEINRSLDYQQQLKNEAERAERSLRESISDIAHDLRTPLTVIRGNLQLIQRDGELSENSEERLRVCIEKADWLKRMADDFFELSVLESDTGAAELERLSAVNEIAQFIADHESLIRQNGITPDIMLPEKNIDIFADSRLLTRMLENLLNNVVKYASGSFRLTVEEQDDSAVIAFSNPAPDLMPEDAEKLFRRTFRADKSRSTAGAGLGLYIVRLLAEKQSAQAKAEVSEGILTLKLIFRRAR